tara:strand:- start:4042 stop:5439 length:1398 start_codon:yes stop_codon:yes gene_type:complete
MKLKFKPRMLAILVGVACCVSKSYADDLMQVYQKAMAHNPEMVRNKVTRDKAIVKIGESRADLLPELKATVGYNHTVTDKDKYGTMPSESTTVAQAPAKLTLIQSLFNWRDWQQFSISKKDALKAEVKYQADVQSFINKTAELYFDVLTKQSKLEASKASQRSLENQLQQMKAKFKVGLVPVSSVHEAQAAYDESVSTVITNENALLNSFEALRALTGVEHKDLAELDIERFSPSTLSPEHVEDWVRMAEKSNLTLTQARMAKETALQSISLESAGHYPDLSLDGSYGRTKVRDGGDTTEKRVGVTLTIPIFDGLRTSSRVEQAQLDYLSATEKLEQSHREVVQKVRSGFYAVKAAISQLKAREQAVISAKSSLRATQAGLEVGTRTIVDMSDATKKLFNKESELAASRFQYIQAVLALRLASGQLTEADLELVNRGLVRHDMPSSPPQPLSDEPVKTAEESVSL